MQRNTKEELDSNQADENVFSLLSNEEIQTLFNHVQTKSPLTLVSRRFRDHVYMLRGCEANRFIKLFITNKYTLILNNFTDCYTTLRHIHNYHCHYLTNIDAKLNKLYEYSMLLMALLIVMQTAPRFTHLRIALNRGIRENAFVIPVGDDNDAQPLIHYSAVNDDDVNQMRNYLLQTFHTPNAIDSKTLLDELINQATRLNISDIQTNATLTKRLLRFFRTHDDQMMLFNQQLQASIQAICGEIGLLRVEMNVKLLGTQCVDR